jgi:hypothetical protein
LEQFGAKHVSPQLLDCANFGEEPVTADVESKSLVLDRPRDAADLRVFLEYERTAIVSREQPRSRESCRTGANDDDWISIGHEVERAKPQMVARTIFRR